MKRFYTNRDLIGDRYGRMFWLPRELARLGWEVEVFCPDFLKRESFSEETEGVRFHSVPARLAGTWALEKPWEGYEADVWLASGQLFAARQAMGLARGQSVPWVLDFYDYYPAFFPKGLQWFADRWARRLMQRCDGVVGASEALVDWAGISCPNTTCIGNGVDRSVFRPNEKSAARSRFGLAGEGFFVGYFGSLDADRGLYETVAAVKLLRDWGLPVDLVCAGRCCDLRALESVDAVWLGMLGQTDLAQVIAACDCALAPYAGGEQVAFSNSCRITEYMACGVPVVATRTGDYERLLSLGYPGLAEPGDAGDLAAAIRRQLEKPNVAPLPEEFEWSSLGKKLDGFLKGLL